MGVRERSGIQILGGFETRLGSAADLEVETALAEIHTIARVRLQALEDKK